MKVNPQKLENITEFLKELKKAIKVIEAHPEMLLDTEESIDYEPIDIEGEPPVHIPINYSMKITLDLDWDKKEDLSPWCTNPKCTYKSIARPGHALCDSCIEDAGDHGY